MLERMPVFGWHQEVQPARCSCVCIWCGVASATVMALSQSAPSCPHSSSSVCVTRHAEINGWTERGLAPWPPSP